MASEYIFPNTRDAEHALTACGFSFGATQRDDPRGVLFGDFIISKWRHLSSKDRVELDGTMTRLGRGPDAPIKVQLNQPFGEASKRLAEMADANV